MQHGTYNHIGILLGGVFSLCRLLLPPFYLTLILLCLIPDHRATL